MWLYVEHSGLDTPELRAIGHLGSRKVATERAGVTHVFTRPRLKALIRKRNIQLVSYRDLQERGGPINEADNSTGPRTGMIR